MDIFKYAKEINFKRNNDGTFQMRVNMDLYDNENKIISEADFTYGRVKINGFECECLQIPYNNELFNVKI